MTCAQASLAIMDSLTANLDPAGRDALRGHLASCPSCSIEAEKLQSWWSALDLSSSPIAPRELKQRVLERAAGEAAVRNQAPQFGNRALRFAVAAAAIVLAWAVGRFAPSPLGAGDVTAPPTADAVGTPFLLLILGEGSSGAASPAASRAIVEEHRQWAVGLARQGKLIEAGKLSDERALVPATSAVLPVRGEDRATGFFLIRARDRAEAERIAATSPHIRHGGRIEVRPIEST